MTHATHHLPIIDVWIGWSLDMQNTHQSFLGSRQRMVNQRVVTGNLQLEFDDGGAARRDAYRLDALKRWAFQAAKKVDPVENFSDDMKGGGKVRSPHTEEDPHRLAHICVERVELGDRPDPSR